MDNRGKRQAASIFGGMGFYIALLVCVVAAGVVGYYALLETNEPPVEVLDQTPAVQPDPGPVKPVVKPKEKPSLPVVSDQPVTIPVPEAESAPAAERVDAPAVIPEAPERAVVVSPLAGETVAVFSVTELAYDETLGDWRTHDGVDIRAAAGSAVAAAADGTVRSVEEDGRLGTMVVIEHPGGVVTTYASLQPETEVLPGDSVRAGSVIGAVGNTSLSEAALGAHLHFAVSKNGESVDPLEYLDR